MRLPFNPIPITHRRQLIISTETVLGGKTYYVTVEGRTMNPTLTDDDLRNEMWKNYEGFERLLQAEVGRGANPKGLALVTIEPSSPEDDITIIIALSLLSSAGVRNLESMATVRLPSR